jgi:hypothetical protein
VSLVVIFPEGGIDLFAKFKQAEFFTKCKVAYPFNAINLRKNSLTFSWLQLLLLLENRPTKAFGPSFIVNSVNKKR